MVLELLLEARRQFSCEEESFEVSLKEESLR